MVVKLTFNSCTTALVNIPAVSMPIARSHKTCNICGIAIVIKVHILEWPFIVASLKVRSHQTRMKRYARMIYMLSQCKDTIDNPAALFRSGANWAFDAPFTRIMRVEKSELWRIFASRSDVITSGGRKSETTMEDKVIVVVCGYPELYINLRTFTKTGIHFAMRLELPGKSPSHDAYSRLLCSEFHARMARISHANEASKLKMFKHPTTCE